MPRKLKTYVTESGFFELAVAAPSMKAALQAWGITINLFQQGLAWETDNPSIVAAAQSAPGRVLRRPLGSKGVFRASAELPKVKGKTKGSGKVPKPRADPKALRAAYAALEEAQARHRKKVATLDEAREALDAQLEKLEREWWREKEGLERRISRLKENAARS